jgi:phosphate uptake regulator
MGYTLLLKKIERVGDQAKNILDLALDGVSLSGAADAAELLELAQTVSEMFREAAELLGSQDEAAARDFLDRSMALNELCGGKVRELLQADEPGHWAVPRAVLYRYWKRIVANLAGIVTGAIEPLQHIDYLDDGQTDIDDD